MGNILRSKRERKVLCVGLDNSGKSTMIESMKSRKQKKHEINPTVGYSTERIQLGNTNLQVLDMSGHSKFRQLWQCYYSEVESVIFVVDSADSVRLCVVKDELSVVKEEISRSVPFLFLANKKDLETAQSPTEIQSALELKSLPNNYRIIATNALNGEGIEEGLKWLNDQMESNDKKSKK